LGSTAGRLAGIELVVRQFIAAKTLASSSPGKKKMISAVVNRSGDVVFLR
jgi:hypothetical protein